MRQSAEADAEFRRKRAAAEEEKRRRKEAADDEERRRAAVARRNAPSLGQLKAQKSNDWVSFK